MASTALSPTANSKVVQVKSIKVDRTMTTATLGAQFPPSAEFISFIVNGNTPSNAATTAVINIGPSAAQVSGFASADVKSNTGTFVAKAVGVAGVGLGVHGVVDLANIGGGSYPPITTTPQVWVQYAETGTASTAGGPWYVDIMYVA